MKKKYIQLGVIVFVLIALTGAFLLLKTAPEVSELEPDTSDASKVIYIYGDASTEDVTPRQIDISNEYGDITVDNITPSGEMSPKLTIRGWESLSLDDYALAQTTTYAKAMRAKEIVSENAAADLKTFGLDAPRATATVHLEDGSAPVILFGANAPGGEGVYAMLKNDSKIYLVSDSAALPYFKPSTAYVNKTITATDPEFTGFDKITLSGANYPEPIVIESTPEEAVETGGVTLHSHAIVSPIRRGIDIQKGLEPLHSVYGLLANDVVAVDDSPQSLEKYGLANPAAIISVVGDTPEMTFTLKISDTAENGEVHLVKDNSKVIYELSPSALPFLPLSLFDMMDKVVAIPNIKNVSTVVVGTEEKGYHTFDLIQEDDGRKLIVTVDGKPLPDAVDEDGKTIDAGENFRKLYQTMIICRYDEPVPKTVTGNATMIEPIALPPDAATAATTAETIEPAGYKEKRIGGIRYDYNNGMGSDYVYFYEGPPRKMEIMLYHENDGIAQPIELRESGYYGQTVYLDRLYEDLEKVLNGIAVKAYL